MGQIPKWSSDTEVRATSIVPSGFVVVFVTVAGVAVFTADELRCIRKMPRPAAIRMSHRDSSILWGLITGVNSTGGCYVLGIA